MGCFTLGEGHCVPYKAQATSVTVIEVVACVMCLPVPHSQALVRPQFSRCFLFDRGSTKKVHEDPIIIMAAGDGRANYLHIQFAVSPERWLPFEVITTDITSGF